MSNTYRFIILVFVAVFGMASHAANFSKNSLSYLQNSGSFAKYTLSPTNSGSISFPNTGWQVVGGAIASGMSLPIVKNQLITLPVNGSLPATLKLLVPHKSVARALVNPWSFIAPIVLQQTLGVLADAACVRIAGGQMVNSNGLWEECRIVTVADKPTLQFLWSEWPDKLAPTANEACALKHPANKNSGGWISTTAFAVPSGIENIFHCMNYYYHETQSPSTTPSQVGQINAVYRCPDGSVPPNNDKNATCSESNKKIWEPTTTENVIAKFDQELQKNPNLSSSAFANLYSEGVEFPDVGSESITGPSSVPVSQAVTVVKTNPDGSTTTSQEQYVRNYTYAGDTVTHVSTTTVNVSNNSVTNSPTTTTTTVPSELQEIKVCGVPGSPACKIDESGTPSADSQDQTQIDSVFQPVKTCLENPLSCLPSMPDLSWTFNVPSSCTAIPVNGYGSYISEINICPFQSVFHDLMSMIWAAVGVFAAAKMLFRDSAGSA